MDIKFWNQPKDLCLGDILNEKLKKGFDKVWIIAGVAKDTGIEIILESVEEAQKLGSEINMYIGIDRKNTSKDVLMKLLNLGCNLFLHINRDENKVETRMYIFESYERESFIYESSGKFSEGGLLTNQSVVQEIIYMPAEKKLFDKAKNSILQGTQNFKETDKEELALLAEKGEVAARITERKIPSINELYGQASSIESIGNDVYDETISKNIFDIPENDVDIDIDINIDLNGEVKKSELSAEAVAKKEKEEKANIEKIATEKLAKFYEDEKDEETDKKVSIIKDVSKIDFTNINIFVFELNKIIQKGLGEGEIKIPAYLFEEMRTFFGSEEFKTITDEKGKVRNGTNVKLEIIDASNNSKEIDKSAMFYLEDRYLAIKSQVFKALNSDEKDIVRLIKKSKDDFCLELIRKDSREYEIWDNVCIYTMKNSKRKFGIM